MKLKYTKIKQRHILVCSDLKKEGVNRKELDALYDPPKGLLRVLDFDESKRIITYDVGCCIPLQSYYKQKCFTEDEVLSMVRQLLTIFNNMEKSRLTMQKLVLEFKYVYFNITDAMLQVVFCPVQNNHHPLESEHIFSFLRELVTNAVIIRSGSGQSSDRIQSFLLFLKKQQQFSTKEIAVFFDDNYEEVPQPTEPAIDIPQPQVTNYPTSYPQSGQSVNAQSHNNSLEPINNPFRNQNTFANSPLPSTIQKPVPVSQTGYNAEQNQPVSPIQPNSLIVSPGDTVDTTEDLSGGFMQPSDTLDASETAYIRNDVTGIEYEVPYGSCTIGRAGVDAYGNPVVPDLVVTTNMRVSKYHAQISYDGIRYYIADLTGKNKTRVNGKIIESGIDINTRKINGRKTVLENGAKIQLASEGYTFIIKDI